MGFFSRRGSDAGPRDSDTATAKLPKKSFGHAAFDQVDIDDARRGHPAAALQSYADATGLEFRGSELAGTFLSTLPTWPEYIFNVCRGRMPSGRLGEIAHELLEVRPHNRRQGGAEGSYPAGLHDLHPPRFKVTPRNEPFAVEAVWIPTTTAHVRAAETTRLPTVRITRFPPTHDNQDVPNRLSRFGLPGYWVMEGGDDESLLATIAESVRPWLNARPDCHVNLRVRYGLVAVTVNGYRHDRSDLDSLIGCADGIAEALSRLTPPPSGMPFASHGPAAATVPLRHGIPQPDSRMVDAYRQVAQNLGMFSEDTSHLMAMVPRSPIPGMPSGVLLGNVPGMATPYRLLWTTNDGYPSNTLRGAAIMPARPDAVTPLGGVLNTQTDMYVEVVDGYVACWRRRRGNASLDSAELARLATATLRTGGLAAL